MQKIKMMINYIFTQLSDNNYDYKKVNKLVMDKELIQTMKYDIWVNTDQLND